MIQLISKKIALVILRVIKDLIIWIFSVDPSSNHALEKWESGPAGLIVIEVVMKVFE